MDTVSIVIPAYNEEGAVRSVVMEIERTLRQQGITPEIIVVDDGSQDRTAQSAASAGARVLRHRSNRGYGAALKTGIASASNEYVVITDADGTYPARYIPQLQYFPILPDQFSWTTTITLAMLCDKYAVSYLPIDYLPRKGKSKIVPWDAGSFFILILRTVMLFRPLRVFFPIVLLALVAGLTKMGIDLSHQPNISASAQLALMSALLILLIGMLGDAIATRMGRFNPNAIIGVQADDSFSFEDPVTEDQDFAERAHTHDKHAS